jgi:hypothetical protein
MVVPGRGKMESISSHDTVTSGLSGCSASENQRGQWRATTAEIDREVTDALTFRPRLKSFFILTTAPDDVMLQCHARLITQRHAAANLFDVSVFGWAEICRRANLHPSVAAKHFGASGGGSEAPLGSLVRIEWTP